MPDYLDYAVNIQRKYPVSKWRVELEKVPEGCRANCEKYLQEIADRMREQLKAVRKMGFRTVEEYKRKGKL